MAFEGTGQGEFAQLVANHVFANKHRNVLLPVVNCDGQTNKIRQDGGTARPSLDWLAVFNGN
jgi:hypothetical protein